MRQACRADTKVGVSDPVVERGIAIAQRTIGTLGITGLSGSRVHIDSPVWHLKFNISIPLTVNGARSRTMGWSGSNFGHALANNGGTRNRAIPWEVSRMISSYF